MSGGGRAVGGWWAAGVRGSVWGCPGERPGVPGGGSLGLLRTDRFWDAFWDAFWMDFGGPDRPKLSSRLSETLILIKSPFSPQVGFLMKSQAHKVPKGHQVPGHEVPAGVGRSAVGWRSVSGGASGGVRGSVRGCPVEGPWAS